MDNLNTLLKFININKNFSDFNLVQNYINSLNFNKFRGGSIENNNTDIINTETNTDIINTETNTDIINSDISNKYTIKEGTLLFHATKNKGINTNKIKIGDVNLYAYFTNNLDTASNTTKLFDSNEKFIHVFKAKKNIDNFVYDISNYNENNSIQINQYGGVCFKYPNENRIQKFKNNLNIQNNQNIGINNNQNIGINNNQNLEIALFNLKDNLEYLYSLNCENIN
jgi:hypothetical protein